MWSVLEPRIESVRRDLAADFGCDPEELAITRNASEALETLIFGLDLQRGDEVLVTNQNYGRMLTSWDTRTRRHGDRAQAGLASRCRRRRRNTSSTCSATRSRRRPR